MGRQLEGGGEVTLITPNNGSPMSERRTRIYHINGMALVQLLNRADRLIDDEGYETFIHRISGIPDGAKVVGVFPVFDPMGAAVLVEHPSFDVVDPMMQSPMHHADLLQIPIRLNIDSAAAEAIRRAIADENGRRGTEQKPTPTRKGREFL